MIIALLALWQASTWTEADRAAAQVTMNQRIDEWSGCVTTAATRYEKSGERPDIIAEAALGACAPAESAFRRSVDPAFRGLLQPTARDRQAMEFVAIGRGKFRDAVIAKVLDIRLARAAAKDPSPKRR